MTTALVDGDSDGDGDSDSDSSGDGNDDSPAQAQAAPTGVDSSDDDAPAQRVNPQKLKNGLVVHVPSTAFPDESAPEIGFWIGRTVRTKAGGEGDVGIKIDGEPVFTWPMEEVAGWVV